MVFDSAQGGGVRPESGTLEMSAVLAGVEHDARLRTPAERCAVLSDVVRASPVLDAAAGQAALGGACKTAPPLAASR
jgi:hypothetical protein